MRRPGCVVSRFFASDGADRSPGAQGSIDSASSLLRKTVMMMIWTEVPLNR